MLRDKDYSDILRGARTGTSGAAAQPARNKSETKTVATPEQHFLGEIESILRAEHGEPFAILGRHPVQAGAERAIAVRAFLPRANEVTVVLENGGASYPARRIHPDGFFEAVIP